MNQKGLWVNSVDNTLTRIGSAAVLHARMPVATVGLTANLLIVSLQISHMFARYVENVFGLL